MCAHISYDYVTHFIFLLEILFNIKLPGFLLKDFVYAKQRFVLQKMFENLLRFDGMEEV